MKRFWSAFLSLTLLAFLVGCSQEQFAGQQANESNGYQGPQILEQSSCSTFTLVKPKVDILYVVDNSQSTVYMGDQIKASIRNTVNSISSQFDYRVVGTKLISTDTNDFQVLTNSSDLAGIPTGARRVTSAAGFNFFDTTAYGVEKGLSRIYNFMNDHISDGLFRKGAYHLVVLISNGYDEEVSIEANSGSYPPLYRCVSTQTPTANPCPGLSIFDQRKEDFNSLKGSGKLNSKQFRLFSLTAATQCKEGWNSSNLSYRKMSQLLYDESGATDSSSAD